MRRYSVTQSQLGAISLLTVVILAIILSTVTTGLLRLSIQDARQSTDDDLTNRAFFAAESGVADALRFIQKKLDDPTYNLKGDVCAAPEGTVAGQDYVEIGSNNDTFYTCQLIDMSPEVTQLYLQPNDSGNIKLSYAGPGVPSGIMVRWHIPGSGTGDDGAFGAGLGLRGVADTSLPPDGSWTFPAMLRANLYAAPSSGSFARSNIINDVNFLNPTNGSDQGAGGGVTAAGLDGQIVLGSCTTASGGMDTSGYACKATMQIPDLGSNSYWLRLTALYAASHIQVSFSDGSGFVNSQALVDVTGRAADVYRRVQASVDISSGVANLLPSYAILSAETICKRLEVTNTVSDRCGFSLPPLPPPPPAPSCPTIEINRTETNPEPLWTFTSPGGFQQRTINLPSSLLDGCRYNIFVKLYDQSHATPHGLQADERFYIDFGAAGISSLIADLDDALVTGSEQALGNIINNTGTGINQLTLKHIILYPNAELNCRDTNTANDIYNLCRSGSLYVTDMPNSIWFESIRFVSY